MIAMAVPSFKLILILARELIPANQLFEVLGFALNIFQCGRYGPNCPFIIVLPGAATREFESNTEKPILCLSCRIADLLFIGAQS